MFLNRCAKCKSGRVFHAFLAMHDRCPNCGHQFEREEGFFMGSMIISYFVSTMSILPVMLIAIFKYDAELIPALAISSAVALITFPLIYRYAKLAWIHIEESLYQSFRKKREQGERVMKERDETRVGPAD